MGNAIRELQQCKSRAEYKVHRVSTLCTLPCNRYTSFIGSLNVHVWDVCIHNGPIWIYSSTISRCLVWSYDGLWIMCTTWCVLSTRCACFKVEFWYIIQIQRHIQVCSQFIIWSKKFLKKRNTWKPFLHSTAIPNRNLVAADLENKWYDCIMNNP